MMATMIACSGGWNRGARGVGGPHVLRGVSGGARQTVAPRTQLTTVWQNCGTLTVSGGAQRQPYGDGHSVESLLRYQTIELGDRTCRGSMSS